MFLYQYRIHMEALKNPHQACRMVYLGTGAAEIARADFHLSLGILFDGLRMCDGRGLSREDSKRKKVRPDAIVATGCLDLPNPVDDTPALAGTLRGALDVRSRRIDPTMKRAAIQSGAARVKSMDWEQYVIASSCDVPSARVGQP